MTLKIFNKSRRGRWNIELNDKPLGYIKKFGNDYSVRVEIDYYQELYLDISKHPNLKEAKDFVRENFATQESFTLVVSQAITNKMFA